MQLSPLVATIFGLHPPLPAATVEVSYGAAISACENRMAWEPALALLEDAKEDLDMLMLGKR